MTKLEAYLNRRIDGSDTFNNLLKFPKYIEIETVNACNARCPMCTINDWERNYPVMRDNVFNKISDEIIENKKSVKRVSLYRDGEPLIDKKMPQRINKFFMLHHPDSLWIELCELVFDEATYAIENTKPNYE